MKTIKITLAALSVSAILSFCQCAQPAANSAQTAPSQQPVAQSTGLKIAYVNVDSLLANYELYLDLREELQRKEEDSRLKVNQEADKLQKDIDDFNKKLQNNVYSSQERAQQEQNRLVKKQQDLQDLTTKLGQELETLEYESNMKVSESVDNFIKEYNKTAGYNMILSRSSLMYIDSSMNITEEVLNGLNEEYRKSKK